MTQPVVGCPAGVRAYARAESTLRHAHGLKLINVDAGMFELYGGHRVYLEITADGALIQHSKDGGRWSRKELRGAGVSG